MTREIWLPPPDLTISQWADTYRRIPPEASAEPGYWSTNRAPYQREIMDAISDSDNERVVVMTAAQVGKTELLLNTIGYYIDKEPSPILVLNPTVQMSETFSKDRLAPMIRDTPCLSVKIGNPRVRDSGNTLLHKKFTGGHITLAGSNSPASLASRPIRVLLCDEVDHYPSSAGEEGDPLSLAIKRTANFWNRKIVMVSTPTIDKDGSIYRRYEQSTMGEWHVPCPVCHKLVPFEWEQVQFKDVTEPVMKCSVCENRFSEREWKRQQSGGQWIFRNSEAEGAAGFHMNAFASPWVTWQEICMNYYEAKKNGEEAMKVWVNTVLGLPYESKEGVIDVETLEENREPYEAELPEGVLLLTCGVDTQDDRLELEVVGWGLRNESWGIEYHVIHGDPELPELWESLEAYLSRTWHFADGTELGISCTCIDSAGHFTDEVYKFCKPRTKRYIFAIIGRGRYGLPSVGKPTRNNRRQVPLFTLGVGTLKGMLHSRLEGQKGDGGYCHFPYEPQTGHRGYDEQYFKGLLSERMVFKRVRGRDSVVWEQRNRYTRNEPLDCRIYAMGAYEILNPDMERHKRKRTDGTTTNKSTPPTPTKKKLQHRGIVRRGIRF